MGALGELMTGLKHQAARARKWRTAIRRVERHLPPHLPPVLFLTDPDRVPDPVAVLQFLPPGSGIIYRHFGAAGRHEIADQLAHLCAKRDLTLLIAADPELAAEVEADGVHWPEARLSDARHWRGCFRLQTASAHSRRALARAARSGMDAALVSTVFASNSASARAPMGPARFRKLAQTAALPIYALGGLQAATIQRISDSGGLAAIDGLLTPNG